VAISALGGRQDVARFLRKSKVGSVDGSFLRPQTGFSCNAQRSRCWRTSETCAQLLKVFPASIAFCSLTYFSLTDGKALISMTRIFLGNGFELLFKRLSPL
jgi:hypothetical protein